jgi:hypothetical protein
MKCRLFLQLAVTSDWGPVGGKVPAIPALAPTVIVVVKQLSFVVEVSKLHSYISCVCTYDM